MRFQALQQPLSSQNIGSIGSADGSVRVTNPVGPNTDLSVTVANLLALPPPVTTGSTIQTYTDPLGDVWVAKNGVNNGAWKRARDVLYVRGYRNAAYNYPTTATVMPIDTLNNDDYGLCSNLNTTNFALTTPVPGIWAISLLHRTTATTAGLYVSTAFAAITVGLQVTATGSGSWTGSVLTMHIKVASGFLIQPQAYASAVVAMAGGGANNFFTAMYVGTG